MSRAQAHEILSKPDVTVTNQKDKDTQLPKLWKLKESITALGPILPAHMPQVDETPRKSERGGMPMTAVPQKGLLSAAAAKFADRVKEVQREGRAGGLELARLFPPSLAPQSLAKSLRSVAALQPSLAHDGAAARRAQEKARELQAKYPTLGLDELAAICLFTAEAESGAMSLCNRHVTEP